jgi:hypothetical protein
MLEGFTQRHAEGLAQRMLEGFTQPATRFEGSVCCEGNSESEALTTENGHPARS